MMNPSTLEYLCGFFSAQNLPKDIQFYSLDGQRVFAIHDEYGAIKSSVLLYLICDRGNKFYKYGIKLKLSDMTDGNNEKVMNILTSSLNDFTKKLEENKAVEVNLDGGDLGFADNV